MADLPLHVESLLVAAGRPPRALGEPVNVPVELSSTRYEQGYGRASGATLAAFESAVGELEGGTAVGYASGMAAVAAVFDRLPAGSTAVVPASAYWGVLDFAREQQRLGRVTLREVELTDTAAVVAALPGADLLWIETPTNPLIDVADVPALCAAAREHGVLSCVDSTMATPLLLRPLAHGADLAMHSATKYLAGHSDAMLGVLVAADPDLAAQLAADRYRSGAIPGAFEPYLALRGLRTLALRVERAQASAQVLAARLTEHPAVTRVRYPGLAPLPDFLAGPGAMLAFELADAAAADAVCAAVRLIVPATSLGGVESLIERRAKYAGEQAINTPEALVRLSVGIEHVEDLWADLAHALDAVWPRARVE